MAAAVEKPDGSTGLPGCEVLVLRDGASGDGEPNDGVYGVVYRETAQDRASASGQSGRGRGRPRSVRAPRGGAGWCSRLASCILYPQSETTGARPATPSRDRRARRAGA